MQSDVPQIQEVLRKLAAVYMEYPCFPWYCRVPSPSNLADAVSRFRNLEWLQEKAEVVEVSVDQFFEKSRAMLCSRADARPRRQ